MYDNSFSIKLGEKNKGTNKICPNEAFPPHTSELSYVSHQQRSDGVCFWHRLLPYYTLTIFIHANYTMQGEDTEKEGANPGGSIRHFYPYFTHWIWLHALSHPHQRENKKGSLSVSSRGKIRKSFGEHGTLLLSLIPPGTSHSS